MLTTLAGAASGCKAAASNSNAAAPNETTRALHALFDEEWEYGLRASPTWASTLGDRRFDALWDDVSLGAVARNEAHAREVVGKIERISRDALSPEDQLSLDLFRYQYRMAVEGQRFRMYLQPLNQRGGIQTADEMADQIPFETTKHFEDWNARLRSFPSYADQTIAVLTEAIAARMTHPKVPMQRVVAQLDAQIVDDPTKSPFFAPYKKLPGSIPPAEAERLTNQAKEAIRSSLVPAYRKLRAFFVDTYLPACRSEVGAWDLPNGAAMYAYLVRAHTTTNMTPDEVHTIGLREVARIRGEMETVKSRAGFSGPLSQFFTFLRTDAKFYYKDPKELLIAYRDLGKRVDPLLVKLFSRLPRTPYGVQAIPDAVAPDTTTAYYREPADDGSRAGTFFVNLYKPETRPIWEMTALTLHESVPGHHLQIALATEQQDIPQFRRHGDYTAFVEGWGLYAESLGEELGLYDDPYAKFGQLAYEMWRAVRLVVDTGIHHLHWDRQRAIDFFLENSPRAELDVVNEVDRYIVWPGQALAYKIGELRIKEIRKKQMAALGPRFDVKAFHEAVLGAGPLPLDILESRVMAPAAKH
ncbi:hypothetical protein AKJ09_00983 [Labilithrix luteola]|uniref:DUF885 domain-containing protein n=1 Tax=Labilithrix luteola TaxID=1391654 RepID=A0A0K1PMH8_9BACT|nr:hypothetical protein AKJ09_00983 [Labilithrix luteola]